MDSSIDSNYQPNNMYQQSAQYVKLNNSNRHGQYYQIPVVTRDLQTATLLPQHLTSSSSSNNNNQQNDKNFSQNRLNYNRNFTDSNVMNYDQQHHRHYQQQQSYHSGLSNTIQKRYELHEHMTNLNVSEIDGHSSTYNDNSSNWSDSYNHQLQQQQQQQPLQQIPEEAANYIPYELQTLESQAERRHKCLYQQKMHRKHTVVDEFEILNYIKFAPDRKRVLHNTEMNLKWANKLQCSEWLIETPLNFDDWFIIPCPKGKRVLLLATQGKTEVYNTKGLLLNTFKSSIPGSRPGDLNDDNSSILEAIYVPYSKQYFLLDVVAYNGVTMTSSKAWYRLSFLTQKYGEDNFEFKIDTENDFSLHLLNSYELAEQFGMDNCLMYYPFWNSNIPAMNGFLFYNKYSEYVVGRNPLVCWILPYMIPEILELPIHENYMELLPHNYIDFKTQILTDELKKAKGKQKYFTKFINKKQQLQQQKQQQQQEQQDEQNIDNTEETEKDNFS